MTAVRPESTTIRPARIGVVVFLVGGAVVLLWLILNHVGTAGPSPVSDVKSDEQLVFFPTHAFYDEKAEVWRVRVHGWLFEPKTRSVKRRVLKRAVRMVIDVPDDAAARKRFDERISRFLVDNERNKRVVIQFGERTCELGRTNKAGHVRATIRLSQGEMRALQKRSGDGNPLAFRALLAAGDKRRFDGRVRATSPNGVSVISDVDDTIKITQVTKRREMLANTFYRPFKPVPGMSQLYRRLQKRGATFHYVSASPWQLHRPLQSLLVSYRFPEGTLHLRDFRLADTRSLNELMNSDSKKRVIAGLLKDFPRRRFLLFGDSGERDPELYGEFARRHTKQIVGIFIRNATGESPAGKRFQTAFRGVDVSRWRVFSEPSQVKPTVVKLLSATSRVR
ncbi:MAG: App1 family protein [Planctomycetaceae bacterium]